MKCEVHPKFIERWADVMIELRKTRGIVEAERWYMDTVPDECKPWVIVAIRKRGGKI